jgi:hypothetical protein
MSGVRDSQLIGVPAAATHRTKIVKDRRRPGRIHDVNPTLIPILRNPTGVGCR